MNNLIIVDTREKGNKKMLSLYQSPITKSKR